MGLLLCCEEGVGGCEGGLGDWDGNEPGVFPGIGGGGGSNDDGGVLKPANKDWGVLAKMESLCRVKASKAAVGMGGRPANKALAASLSMWLFSPELFVDAAVGDEVSPAKLPKSGWWGKFAAAAANECLMLLLLLLASLFSSSCSPPLMIKSLVSYTKWNGFIKIKFTLTFFSKHSHFHICVTLQSSPLITTRSSPTWPDRAMWILIKFSKPHLKGIVRNNRDVVYTFDI